MAFFSSQELRLPVFNLLGWRRAIGGFCPIG